MKAIDHHLYDRGGRYYYRSALPRNLKPFLPFHEIKLSLGTNNLGQARLFVARLDIEVQKLLGNVYSTLEQSPTPEGLEHIKRLLEGCYDSLRKEVGLTNIRQSPHWYSSALNATSHTIKTNTLSKISEEYLKECITNSKKTIEHKRTTYELFISIIGDLTLDEITRTEARKYKTQLLNMPSNLLKLLKNKSYLDVNWNDLPQGKKQSYITVNNRLTPLIALFTWAETNELYNGSNPFSGLIIKEAKQYATRRTPYKVEELKTLFTCPIYKGCRAQETGKRLETGKEIYKDYLYWIPLVGLYSGMRLNEICQLEVEDIENNEGVWCFNINDAKDKKLKTLSSKRIVPIHQKLIDLGFVDYVLKQSNMRIFYDLKVGSNGSYSHRFTRQYSRLLEKLNLKRQGLCFHSFRHSFIDGLRNAGVERSIAMRLAGHGNSNDIHNNYGYGYNMGVLKKEINQLSFKILED